MAATARSKRKAIDVDMESAGDMGSMEPPRNVQRLQVSLEYLWHSEGQVLMAL